jgi:2-oxoglutarate ferredoxin oxidoreductase subunit gamma
MMNEPTERKEIRLAGFGGQGVILAGLLLGQAAVNDGKFAAGSNSYGPQARGSACKADLIVSDNPIDYPHVERAHMFVAMSQGGYDAFQNQVAGEGQIFYDSGLVTPAGGPIPETGLDVTDMAMKEFDNKQVANLIWVGILAGATGWFSQRALERAAEQHVPGRFLELNLRCLSRGLQLGRGRKMT